MVEHEDYRGYRIDIRRGGQGWFAYIYPPGARSALNEMPNVEGRDELMVKVRTIIDADVEKRSQKSR